MSLAVMLWGKDDEDVDNKNAVMIEEIVNLLESCPDTYRDDKTLQIMLELAKKDLDLVREAVSVFMIKEKTVHRPWGSFTVLAEAPGYKIKSIIVKSKEILSYQKHKHRSEHWTVVRGEATITLNDKKISLKKDESIYIPKEAAHRLANNAEEILEVIEVQIGDYLGEDDITRLEDKYGRVNELVH